jgi:hypothetical protein
MGTDTGLEMDRVYPYRGNPLIMGCGVTFFVLAGCAAFTMIPLGLNRVNTGDAAAGYVLLAVGVANALLLFIGSVGAWMLVRDVAARPSLRLTPTSLVLPEWLRGRREMDDRGEPLGNWQPPEIPFTAIRWARRERGRAGDCLLIVHALGPNTLVLDRSRMRRADFDELDAALRTAIPAAFATAPPIA